MFHQKKTSNAGYIHQKPAAQTNTSIQGQKELNPSSIGSFLSKHWWALAYYQKNKKIKKAPSSIYVCYYNYYLTTFYNSLTLPAIHCHLIHKLHIATYYLDYVSVKLLNLSECYL
jgi:hypothetical protein